MAAPKVTGDVARKDFDTLAASVEIPILVVAHDFSAIAADVSTKDTKNPFSDQAAQINQGAYGKKAGAMVHVFKAKAAGSKELGDYQGFAVAAGADKADKWAWFGAGTAGKNVTITPAA